MKKCKPVKTMGSHTSASGGKRKKDVFQNWDVVDRELYVSSWQSALFIPQSFLIPAYYCRMTPWLSDQLSAIL